VTSASVQANLWQIFTSRHFSHCYRRSTSTVQRFTTYMPNLLARIRVHTCEGFRRRKWMLILFFASLLCMHQASSFVVTPRHRPTTMARFAEEKKDDGVLYWEVGISDILLPSFQTRPKMIVFDKDGTTANLLCLLV